MSSSRAYVVLEHPIGGVLDQPDAGQHRLNIAASSNLHQRDSSLSSFPFSTHLLLFLPPLFSLSLSVSFCSSGSSCSFYTTSRSLSCFCLCTFALFVFCSPSISVSIMFQVRFHSQERNQNEQRLSRAICQDYEEQRYERRDTIN